VTKRLSSLHEQGGFTIIEVMVAIFVLVLGVLGSAVLVNAANGLSLNSKSREGATNLAREIIEAARAVDYDSLTPTLAAPALQAQPGLADADPSTPGWQIIRRGVKYTVNSFSGTSMQDSSGNPNPCAWDDPRDGTRSTTDTSLGTLLCAGLATANPALNPATSSACARPPSPPCIDANPDDYRRLEVSVQWTRNGVTRTVNQVGIIVNPSGGLGPRISSLTPASQTITSAAAIATSTFTAVTGTSATAVDWAADDLGNTRGSAALTSASSPPSWTFTWNLGAVGSVGAVLDGTYTLNVQAYDTLGIPGDTKTATVTLNRSAPFAPGALAGGRDDRAGTQTELIDLKWPANAERDIVGYHVYRVGSPDTLVCDTTTFSVTTRTYCSDRNLPTGTAALVNPQYYVKALDTDPATNTVREGASSAVFSVPSIDAAPVWPAGTTITATTSGGLPTLTWSAQATDPNNGNAAPLFYRIYRDGNQYADRYDVTGNGTQLSFTDSNPGTTSSHTYRVTPVSIHYQEGAALGPVTSP
jgi:type II secretory pathway pseudopilin PulG